MLIRPRVSSAWYIFRMRLRPHSGFTLVELLVVIAIIGLLSSVVLASLNVARGKSLDVQRASNLRSIQQALDLYASSNNGAYPSTGGSNSWQSHCPGWPSPTIPGLVPTYLGTMPIDSKEDDANNFCCYIYTSDSTNYKLLFHNCVGNSNSVSSLIDPQRSGVANGTNIEWSVYTPGASGW